MRNPNPTIMPPFGSYINPDHPLAKGLVGYWLFNEHEGRFVNDLSPYGNNGRIFGGASWKDGLYFNGSDTYVDCGNDKSLNITDTITFGARIKPLDLSNVHRIIGKSNSGSEGFKLYSSSNEVCVTIVINGTPKNASADGAVSIGQPYYVTGVYDGANVKIYVNNIETVGDAAIGNISLTSKNLYIGTYSWSDALGSFFCGFIDGAYLYNRALSPNEIEWLIAEPYCFIIWPGHRFIFDYGRLKCHSKHRF